MVHRPAQSRRAALAAILVVLALLTLGATSCSRRLGWGLVLWTSPEGPIPSGSVVPVYIRSNINKVYVVGVPKGSTKVELPFWQVELYPSYGKAKAAATAFAPVASLYLVAARDGLPVRESPSNTADRVYRLREGQSVKILEKVKGDEVRTGDQVLQGDWYLVLADDGTRGYSFSNTLKLYDESTDSAAQALGATKAPAVSVKIDALFAHSWRPEYFQAMMDEERVDLDRFSARFGIFTDAIHRQIRIELPAVSQVFDYQSISQDGAWFSFEGSPLKVRFDGDKRLVADWSGIDPAATAATAAKPAAPQTAKPAQGTKAAKSGADAPEVPGALGSAYFVVLDKDLKDAIRTEELRRRRLLDAFVVHGSEWRYVADEVQGGAPAAPQGTTENAAAESGAGGDAGGVAVGGAPTGAEPGDAAVPAPTSAGAGAAFRLGITGLGRCTVANPGAAPAGYFPEGLSALNPATGDVAIRLGLGQGLRGAWEGVISFRFDKLPGGAWVDFLYRFDGPDLILGQAAAPTGLEVGQAGPLLPLRFARGR